MFKLPSLRLRLPLASQSKRDARRTEARPSPELLEGRELMSVYRSFYPMPRRDPVVRYPSALLLPFARQNNFPASRDAVTTGGSYFVGPSFRPRL